MNIVFMGTPAFAATQLEYLLRNGYNVSAVVTVPDRPAGRGLQLHESEVKKTALQYNIPVLQPEKLRDEAFIQALEALRPDVMVVVAFRMLPRSVWKIPRLGTFNLHASLLPAYRGAAPINHAVMNGETRTGLTTFLIDDKIDTGNILLSESLEIGPDEDAGSLHDRLMMAGGPLIARTIDGLEKGEIQPQPQPVNSDALPAAPKIFPEDCILDLEDHIRNIYNKVRGLSPYPGARIYWDPGTGKIQMLKIFSAEPAYDVQGTPGTYTSDGKTGIYLHAADGSIRINELQAEGKKRMPAADFLRGMRNFPNAGKVYTAVE
ncbi:MAG: methionyl-tRNA formyltransferase [Bacteroidia bacterium]|nr:methionyl-tRNA formyltransferase [Bacteroidia bacterium]